MRNIDTALTAELAGANIRPFMLVEIDDGSAVYRYTDCDVPLYDGGNKYEPRGLELGAVSYSTNNVVDNVSLKVSNLDDVLTSAFVGGDPQGADVTVKMVLLNTDTYQIIGGVGVAVFTGTVDRWSLPEGEVEMTVASEFQRWAQKTLASYSPSCRWKNFKGTRCGYSGAEVWCDRTYTRCVALGNSANFGGFRWLPSIMGKDVWWGTVPG